MFAQPAQKKKTSVRPGPIQMAAPRGPQLQGPVQQAPAYVQRAPQRLNVVGGPAYQPVPQRPAPIDIAQFSRDLVAGFTEAPRTFGAGLAFASPDVDNARRAMEANANAQTDTIIKFAQRLKDPNLTPQNRARIQDYLKKNAPAAIQAQEEANRYNQEIIAGTDPIKMGASVASMGIDVATAPVALGAIPLKAGAVQAAKQLAKNSAKTAAMAAPGGALSPVIQQGADARAQDIAMGGLAGAAIGAAIPVGAYGIGKAGQGVGKVARNSVELHKSMTPAQRQAGSIQLPGGPEYKPSKAIIKAEDDFANGKITVNQLEKIRQADAAQLAPTTKDKILGSKPVEFLYGDKAPVQAAKAKLDNASPIDASKYIDDMTQAQKAAQKGTLGLRDKTSDFKEKFIDDLAPIEDRLNKAIKDGADVDPLDHITYQLDRSRRAEGVMNAYVKDNQLDKIIQNVDDTNAFDQYLIARHAKELDPEITTGRNAANDAAIVKQLEGKYGPQAQALYQYNQKLLDTSVDYGLISKETAAALKKQYPEYVPFNRIFNEDELAIIGGGNGKGDASISTQGVVKKIKGSKRAIASPLNSIIDKTRVVVEQGERNRAAQMLASYKDLPGNPFNLKEIPANETIGSRNTISFLENGVKRTFETDKVIADAAKNMTRQEIGLWGRVAAVPARVLRGGATAVNVGFAGANVVKDVVGAAINSRHPFRIADPEAVGKALSAALRHNGKEYQELMRVGVTGTSFDMYRNPLKSNIGEIRSQKNIGTRAVYNATHPGQWYRTLENTIGRSEDFGRALQYYSNKKGFTADGKSPEVAQVLAADQARHNSTNFFRHGSYGQGVNLAIPYWNAGVQGARIQARRIKERPVQTVAKMGFAIAAPSAMIAMNNYMDPAKREVIENIPDYEKEGNIIIVGPNAKFNEEKNQWDGVFKFPVPPQHIGIHKTVQDGVRAAVMGEKFDVIGNLGTIAENYTTVNPTDPKAVANRYIPQGIKLVAEPMTNTNFYTGNKIVPDSQKNLPAADQYNEYSSGTAKVLGKVTNTSPRQLDNFFRTSMGGAGQNLLNFTDSGLAAVGAIDKKEVRGKDVGDSVLGRFYGPNAISPSDKAEKDFERFKKQVTDSDAYKKAEPYDKGRMLNRLESDLNAVAYDKAGKTKEGDKLTKKQQSLKDEGFKVDTYTSLDSKSEGSTTKVNAKLASSSKDVLKKYDSLDETKRNEWFAKENDAEFKYAAAKYENDKAEGKIDDIQDMGRRKSLAKEEVGSKFPKRVRDLYTKGKADVYNYVINAKDGEQLAKDLIDYDNALYAAGLTTYDKPKFINGLAPQKGGRKGSGTRTAKAKKGRATSKGSRGGKQAAPKMDSGNATAIRLAALGQKKSTGGSFKKTLQVAGGIRKPGIAAFKKAAKTNVNVRRTA